MLTLNDGRNELFQWDTGRVVSVNEVCESVHFSNAPFGKAIIVPVENGEANIPDELLIAEKLYCWVFIGNADNGFTKTEKVFEIKKRAKPSNYVFAPTEQITLQRLEKRVLTLEETQDPEAIDKAVKDYLAENPVEVDLTDYYTKEETKEKVEEETRKALQKAKESGEFDGEDGYTPQNGIDYYDGEKGEKGDDGKTPEKGVDYFTEADKSELVSDVLNALPEWQGGSY